VRERSALSTVLSVVAVFSVERLDIVVAISTAKRHSKARRKKEQGSCSGGGDLLKADVEHGLIFSEHRKVDGLDIFGATTKAKRHSKAR
jgi:hypothetical protein